jgi:hypothetical protein
MRLPDFGTAPTASLRCLNPLPSVPSTQDVIGCRGGSLGRLGLEPNGTSFDTGRILDPCARKAHFR